MKRVHWSVWLALACFTVAGLFVYLSFSQARMVRVSGKAVVVPSIRKKMKDDCSLSKKKGMAMMVCIKIQGRTLMTIGLAARIVLFRIGMQYHEQKITRDHKNVTVDSSQTWFLLDL